MSSLQQTGRFLPFANSNIQRKQLSSQGKVFSTFFLMNITEIESLIEILCYDKIAQNKI